METIENLLHRRTDLSTFVVHFTRDTADSSASSNLLSILRSHRLEARSVYGMGRALAARFPEVEATQQTVCFTETPLEHAWMMCADIEGRGVRFNGYGLAFTKTFARRHSINPVWYIDQAPGHDWLTVPINELVEQAEIAATPPGADQPDPAILAQAKILRITPFIEQMGPMTTGGRKEFWWEREWRHQGDMRFSVEDIVVVFAPVGEHENLRSTLEWSDDCPAFVDASWGLERMIATLAHIGDIGPFP
jgi:hypothetical protein